MNNKYISIGRLNGDKTRYSDGIGYSIWYPFESGDSGLCFDISEEDINDAIRLLQQLKNSPVMIDATNEKLVKELKDAKD